MFHVRTSGQTRKGSKYSQRNNGPKKLHKTATTYINIEGVGFPVGEKPFEFKKGKQASGKKEVFVDKKYICYGGEGK